MSHRTLVYLDEYAHPFRQWGWWCMDCPLGWCNYETELRAQWHADRHKATTQHRVVAS